MPKILKATGTATLFIHLDPCIVLSFGGALEHQLVQVLLDEEVNKNIQRVYQAPKYYQSNQCKLAMSCVFAR